MANKKVFLRHQHLIGEPVVPVIVGLGLGLEMEQLDLKKSIMEWVIEYQLYSLIYLARNVLFSFLKRED